MPQAALPGRGLALWLHYLDDPAAVKLGTEYLWGRDLLLAPVTARGATTRPAA